jgi:hypothetical protein
MGKTQVATKVKITIPRIELMAAVNSVRLARKVKGALKIPLAGSRYFTDSSAVLRMLRAESGRFTEFVGARVSEVKVNNDVEEEWLWLVGTATLRISRQGQMPHLKNWALDRSIMAWMREPVESWPCKKSFSPAPEEEFRKDMMKDVYNVVKGIKESPLVEVCLPTVRKRRPWQAVKRVRIRGRCHLQV